MRESKRSNGAKGKTTARTGVSLATVILLAAFLLFTTLPAALASPDWSDPDWISTLSESNEYAFIAVDSAGTAHVVWFEWDVGEIWYNAGTPGDWPDPELLSTHSDYWQEDPRLALDPDDNVHVVWEGYDDAEDEYSIWYSTNAGGTWSDPVAISTQSTYSQYNARIAVGPDGKVNVVWEGYDAAGSEYWIWYASNAGGTWSDPVNISPDDNYPYYPEIAVDSTGAAHTVWHGHNYEIGIDCDILYATNTGGTWSYPEFVSGIHEHSGSYWPSIAIDPSDNPHVVWEGYDDEDGYYYWIWYATRAGGAWSDPYRLSTQSGYDQYDPKIAVGPDGSAHVVWYGYDAGGDYYQVYYAGNSGGAWSAPVRLSTNLQYDQYDPQIRVGPEGKAHVVWYGYDADYYYYRVYYASNPGGAWTDPVLVSHQPEWDSYYAQIALDLCGNPHVVWDDYDSTTYEDDIWYSADITQCIVRAAVEGGHGMVDPEMQAVPVGGTATIALIPDEGYRVGSVTDNGAAVEPTPTDVYTIENVTEYHEVVVTFVPAIADWYLAEGATAGDFDTWVLVQNPGPDPVTVDLTMMTEKGPVNPADLQGVTVPGLSRLSFSLDAYVTSYDVSTLVTASGDVVCERAMYGGGGTWGTDSLGVTAPCPVWYLAEGSTAGGMETYVLVQNPGPDPVLVSLDFMTSGGGKAGPQKFAVPGDTRVTFYLNDYVSEYDVSTLVTATGDVVCERSMYGGGRTWAHCSAGVNMPSDTWYLAEGSTDGGMETFVLVQNPNPTAVEVSLDFMTPAGAAAGPRDFLIAGNARHTFKVNDYVTDWSVSTMVTSNKGPVICERAMYGGDRTWGTDSAGVTAPAGTWYLAEGSTAGGMETFVLVQNPGPDPVLVDLDFMTPAGEQAGPHGFAIPGNARYTFAINDYLTEWSVSTRVTSTGPVICERAMYGNVRTWAHNSIGYAP